jgi:EpsI family protein
LPDTPKDKNMTIRIFVAAAVLLAINIGVYLVKGRGMPTQPAQLDMQVQELPRQLGPWTAEDRPLDPNIFKAIGAAMAIDRRYQDAKKTVIDLHTAVFLDYGVRTLHPPELCYSGAGFQVNDARTVDLGPEGGTPHPARLLTLDREGQQIYCLYWYQIGDATFFNGDGQRTQVRSFRGRTTRPPMIKVMLQTVAASPAEAEQRLTGFAAPVLAWTRDFH